MNFKGITSLLTDFVGNKAKGRISKRVFQESKARQNFRKTNISYPLIIKAFLHIMDQFLVVFFKEDVLKNFAKTRGEHLSLNLFLNKIAGAFDCLNVFDHFVGLARKGLSLIMLPKATFKVSV